MSEEVLSPTEVERTEAPRDLPASLDINELQALSPTGLEDICRRLDVRMHAGRSRHHHILDVVRCGLSQNIPVTVEGFFDQVAELFGWLRNPALNFVALPEDVGVSRETLQQYKFRPGQLIAGTVRLPREREKSIMLDEVTDNRRLCPRRNGRSRPRSII